MGDYIGNYEGGYKEFRLELTCRHRAFFCFPLYVHLILLSKMPSFQSSNVQRARDSSGRVSVDCGGASDRQLYVLKMMCIGIDVILGGMFEVSRCCPSRSFVWTVIISPLPCPLQSLDGPQIPS